MFDIYSDLAERYDWMKDENPLRQEFLRRVFIEYGVKRVLDCACGTGKDLLMFHSMGLESFGSDLSASMLAQAEKRVGKINIPLRRVDFRELGDNYDMKFDAIVCLSNSINEPLEDQETLRALHSMKSVLRPGGVLIFDQGQSDASMTNPPRFVPVVNNRDFTRFFAIEYSGDVQTVNIFDFIHTLDKTDFNHCSVRIRIRLLDSWIHILRETGFDNVRFFGNWDFTPYDKGSSSRLIAVAKN